MTLRRLNVIANVEVEMLRFINK